MTRVLWGSVVLAVGGLVSILLGLDAAAEMPLNSDRFATLLGTGLGGLALLVAAAGLVAVDTQRRIGARRAELRVELYEALAEPVEPAERPERPARRRRRSQ